MTFTTDRIKKAAAYYAIVAVILSFLISPISSLISKYIPFISGLGSQILNFITIFVIIALSDLLIRRRFII